MYEVIPEPEEEVYTTLADFQSTNAGDGLSFSAGCSVTVVTKNPSGWWYVEMGDKEGWVPSSYLERAPKELKTPLPSLVSSLQPAKSSPVQRRQLPQSNKKSTVRRSTSEETLAKINNKPSHSHTARVNSPPAISSWMTSSHPSPQHKPIISISPSSTVNKNNTSHQREIKKHTSVVRSASSDEQIRNRPHKPPRAQQSLSSLNVPKQHIRANSAGNHSILSPGRHSKTNTSGTEPTPVSELTKILQKKQAAATSANLSTNKTGAHSGRSKISSSGTPPKTPSPSTTRRLDLSKKQPPQRPKPYGGAKRPPPKRPEPPKANTISTQKTAPPRPSTSPGQKRKFSSSYTVMCDYSGGDGQLTLKKGQSVEVLEKNNDGWWYVKAGFKEGWAPASFLDEDKPERPPRPNPVSGSNKPSPTARPVPKPRRTTQTSTTSNTYRAAVSYQVPAYEDSGITLVIGKTYEVLEKAGGWWFISDGENEGWAPSSYLDPA